MLLKKHGIFFAQVPVSLLFKKFSDCSDDLQISRTHSENFQKTLNSIQALIRNASLNETFPNLFQKIIETYHPELDRVILYLLESHCSTEFQQQVLHSLSVLSSTYLMRKKIQRPFHTK